MNNMVAKCYFVSHAKIRAQKCKETLIILCSSLFGSLDSFLDHPT